MRAAFAAVGLGLLLVACGREPPAEEAIRALVAAGEAAAEAGEARAVLDLVADDYRDGAGRSRADLERLVRGWLVVHRDVGLVTVVESVEVESPEHARAVVAVGMAGRRGEAEAARLTADLERVELSLRRDGDRWRVTRADWEGSGGAL